MSNERLDHIMLLLYRILDRLDVIEERLNTLSTEQESVVQVEDEPDDYYPPIVDWIAPRICEPMYYPICNYPLVYNDCPIYNDYPVDWYINPVDYYVNGPIIEPIYEYNTPCYELIVFDC